MTDMWWERRRDGERTPVYLARVLAALGVPDKVVHDAEAGHFDDFAAPPDVADGRELTRLVELLGRWGRGSNRVGRQRAAAVAAAVRDGEFDATKAEADAWLASPEGQQVLAEFAGSAPRRGGAR